MRRHIPALLQETIDFLKPKPKSRFIDATIGQAGHTKELLKQKALVLGIDRDKQAIKYIIENPPKQNAKNLVLAKANFSQIGKIAWEKGFRKVDGILFDLGVSTLQLEDAKRGFSFIKEGPLDMRMDQSLNIKAYDLVNKLDERRLNEILKTYGQEKFSRTITGAICSARQVKTIETTRQLAQIIEEATNKGVRKYFRKESRGSQAKIRVKKLHPATKTFQALRIVTNSELLNLEEALPQTVDLLKTGGRLVIISFHSLEDRIVKRFLKSEPRLKVLTKKPIGPSESEIAKNPRSRSAKLRVAEKI